MAGAIRRATLINKFRSFEGMRRPKSCSIIHWSLFPKTSMIRYLLTATPTESNPGPILALVAGTIIFILFS